MADLKKFGVSRTFLLTRCFLLDILEYAMIETTSRQSWLGYLPLARQAALRQQLLRGSLKALYYTQDSLPYRRGQHCVKYINEKAGGRTVPEGDLHF